MRQLTVETVDGETPGKRATWLLPAAMLARRQQGAAMVINGSRCVKVL